MMQASIASVCVYVYVCLCVCLCMSVCLSVCLCVELLLDLVSTWGDEHYIGLTGLQLVGADAELIAVDMSMISAEPRDLHQLPGHELDDRTLDKYVFIYVCLYLSMYFCVSLCMSICEHDQCRAT